VNLLADDTILFDCGSSVEREDNDIAESENNFNELNDAPNQEKSQSNTDIEPIGKNIL